MVGIRVSVRIKDLGLGLVSLSVVRTANLQETHAQSVRFWAFFLSFFLYCEQGSNLLWTPARTPLGFGRSNPQNLE